MTIDPPINNIFVQWPSVPVFSLNHQMGTSGPLPYPDRAEVACLPCLEITLQRPRFDVYSIRNRIVNILNCRPGSFFSPKYLGCPPPEEIESVRDQILSEMAYQFWLLEDKPEGRADVHWAWAIEDWQCAKTNQYNPWI